MAHPKVPIELFDIGSIQEISLSAQSGSTILNHDLKVREPLEMAEIVFEAETRNEYYVDSLNQGEKKRKAKLFKCKEKSYRCMIQYFRNSRVSKVGV